MLSQCPLDQFIFKIRVLLNKAVEFDLTCLSCSPIAVLSSGSRHYSRKGILFFTNGKRKKCAKASGSVISLDGWPPLLAFFKKGKQHQARLVFGWVTALDISSGRYSSRESTSMHMYTSYGMHGMRQTEAKWKGWGMSVNMDHFFCMQCSFEHF